MTVTVKKIGGSVAVLIPKAVARELELTEGTPLEVTTSAAGILLKKRTSRRARRPIAELIPQVSPASYRRRAREFAADRPVGKESW
jgi:antitoxin component of MazEF toxin-antitoxin module